jgi:hypothetical protein
MARAIDLGLFVPVGGANRRQELMGVKLCSEPTKESAMSESRIAKPVKAHHFVGQAISLRDLRSDVQRVNGFNAKIAVFLTNIVGSMWCAYVFALIALLGLRPALRPGGEGIIAWIAQTFLQLVLLSVIMVGQNVQSQASDIRSQHTYDDTVEILDRLDVHTQGGLKDLADRIDALEVNLTGK